MRISVVICSHNPRPPYLKRVLHALAEQTLPKAEWDLLLIDNASERPLALDWDLSWHPNSRHLSEGELGLTSARLRGIAESGADILVFVDDDNVLDRDYLANAAEIGNNYPFLGAWGGAIRPDFESEPEPWARDFLPFLALRDLDRAYWSNNPHDWKAQPCGAGLCVRRGVAARYRRLTGEVSERLLLDRKGSQLSSEGDHDLVRCVGLEGLGFGVFPTLRMTHIIPSWRLTETYLFKLTKGNAFSNGLLESLWGGSTSAPYPRWKAPLKFGWIYLRLGRRSALFFKAREEGLRELQIALQDRRPTKQPLSPQPTPLS